MSCSGQLKIHFWHIVAKGLVLKSFIRLDVIIEAHGVPRKVWYLDIFHQERPNNHGSFLLFLLDVLYHILKWFPQILQKQLDLYDYNVDRAFKALCCQMCGKYFKKTKNSRNTCKKNPFFTSHWKYQDFRHLDQNPKCPRNIWGFNNHNLSHTSVKHWALK